MSQKDVGIEGRAEELLGYWKFTSLVWSGGRDRLIWMLVLVYSYLSMYISIKLKH